MLRVTETTKLLLVTVAAVFLISPEAKNLETAFGNRGQPEIKIADKSQEKLESYSTGNQPQQTTPSFEASLLGIGAENTNPTIEDTSTPGKNFFILVLIFLHSAN